MIDPAARHNHVITRLHFIQNYLAHVKMGLQPNRAVYKLSIVIFI